MIVYWSSDLDFGINCLSDLQKKRTSNNQVNFLTCPAVKNSWKNVWMFGAKKDLFVEYNLDNVVVEGFKDAPNRKPHLKNTNIFNLRKSSIFFSEKSLKAKVTAPYFHNVAYQKEGTFIGGVYDIGRWARPINAEIITWGEVGAIKFNGGEPLFYVEFLTDEKIELVRFKHSPLISQLSASLINSPFQTPKNFQGSLDSRYEAFDRSNYRAAILEEIQANLLPAEG